MAKALTTTQLKEPKKEKSYLPVLSVVDVKSFDRERRTIDVTMTTNTKDRQGDIVESTGLMFENYMQNPVVLWVHDLKGTPIGRVISLRPGAARTMATVEFADTPKALEIMELYAKGFLKAWSIGFMPLEWRSILEDDPKTGIQRQTGFRITKAEVLELSAVPVPANPEALSKALCVVSNEELKKALTECGADDDESNDWFYVAMKGVDVSFSDPSVELANSAFGKSVSERGIKGSVPVTVVLVENESDAHVEIESEVLQRSENGQAIAELKLLCVRCYVPRRKAASPGSSEPGRAADTPAEGNAGQNQEPDANTSAHSLDDDLAECETVFTSLEAALIDIPLE